jgi:type I restriction enzyme S subunit
MTPEIKKRIEQIRCGKVPEGYKKTKAGIIPRDWNLSSLDSFGKWVGGGTPSKDVKEYWENGTIPWISSQEVKSSIIDTTTYMITKKAVDESSTTLVPPNSIIVVTRSGILRHTFPVSKTQKAMAINQDIKALILDKPENVDFLIKVIEHNETDLLRSYVKKGTTVESVIFDSFSKYTIPIMESDEKFKITEILTTQDRIIALQQQKIEEIQRLKKACLAKMFPKKGSTVPEIRFPGFTDPWEQRRLGELLQTIPLKPYIKEPEQEGEFEIIQQGNDPIIGFANGIPCDDYENTVVFGDHTLSLYKPKRPFFVATDGIRIIKGKQRIDGFYLLSLLEKYKPQNEGYKRYYSIQQQRIGKFFKDLDSFITLHERKLEEMQKFKKALMQLLLTGIVRVL